MSEVLKVPEEWEVKKLKEIGSCKNGLTYSPDDIVDSGGLLVLRSSNIQENKLAFNDNVFVRTDMKISYRVQNNDILICVRNGSKNLIGKNTLITKEVENMAHGAFMTVFNSTINDYVFQLFQSDMYYRQVEKNLGATINSINNSDLLLFEFPFPKEKTEQQKIAKILSTLDKTIEATQKLIDKEKNIKKGLMHDLLTNGIDSNGKIRTPQTHTYKQSELGLIPEELESQSLGSIVKIVGGGTPSRDIEEYWKNGTIPWVTVKDLHHNLFIIGSEEKITENGVVNSATNIIPANNLITSTRMGIGRFFINKVDITINQDMKALLPKKNIDNLFLLWCLLFYGKRLELLGTGTTVKGILLDDLKSLRLLIPNLQEQKQIAKILTTQDKKIQTEEINLAKLKELKKGLMNDLLSGTVRVKI